MTELKKCNSQLFKELSETKSNLENVKAKLAQCKHNIPADYQPGMLSGREEILKYFNIRNFCFTEFYTF